MYAAVVCTMVLQRGWHSVSQDRRIHYRVTPTIEREVRVFAVTNAGITHQVGLIDISAGGISFGVSQSEKLRAEVGDILTLRFETGRLLTPLEIKAKLCHEKTADTNIVYGAAFEGWENERHGLAPQLRSMFNEREAVRVDPGDDEVSLDLQSNGHSNPSAALLRDISILGVGIWLTDDDQPVPNEKDLMTVGIQLTPSEGPLEIVVRVCHTHRVGERVRIGAEIQGQSPQDARDQTKAIMNYVMKRQIEVARIDAERRRAMQEHYPTS